MDRATHGEGLRARVTVRVQMRVRVSLRWD